MVEMTLHVEHNVPIAASTWRMVLRCEDDRFFDAFSPGQFLQLRVPNAPHLLLRRPISVHMADRRTGLIELLYFVCGQGTEILAKVEPGTPIAATGPLGKGFDPGDAKTIWLLAGGLGCAPLYSVMQAAPDRNYTCFFGFPEAAQIIDLSRYESMGTVKRYTDDGSAGVAGYALDGLLTALVSERPDLVMACGPTALLRAMKRKWPADLPCQVSLESRMGCGTGACLVCNCKIAADTPEGWTHKRVCADGPVFPLGEVIFD